MLSFDDYVKKIVTPIDKDSLILELKKSLEKNLLSGTDDNGCPYLYIDIDDTHYLAKQVVKDLFKIES